MAADGEGSPVTEGKTILAKWGDIARTSEDTCYGSKVTNDPISTEM